jgi:hypothetical protein
MLGRRTRALDLYRRCLRSAAQCPRPEHRAQMQFYARMRFDDARRVQDSAVIERLLREGEAELERMDYYHKVRRERDAEAMAAALGDRPPASLAERSADSGATVAPASLAARTPLYRNRQEAELAAIAASQQPLAPAPRRVDDPRQRRKGLPGVGIGSAKSHAIDAVATNGAAQKKRAPPPASAAVGSRSVWDVYDAADGDAAAGGDEPVTADVAGSEASAASLTSASSTSAVPKGSAMEADPLAELLKPKLHPEPMLDVNAGYGSRLSPLHAALLAGDTESAGTAHTGAAGTGMGRDGGSGADALLAGHRSQNTAQARSRASGRTSGNRERPAISAKSRRGLAANFCAECGAALVPADARFCSQCGTCRV